MTTAERQAKQSEVKKKPSQHRVQNTYLQRHVGHTLVCLLNSKTKVKGKLLEYDTYTLLLETPEGEEFLVFKHHIELIKKIKAE
ncbi:RNA chaperone Hfq [Bacillus licheniformis]|uniref:RNA chaperone Hfq n=1 Tax=Bacillus licheniformis TaxID=1402 RepID=UPI002DBF9FBD|nr:RNA chaperone Hfq [Bacillus licheniformis]MEC0476017.1 RNA chaperone Hfq [Bacillus licheniformis]